MNRNPLLKRTASQLFATGFGFVIVAVLLTGEATVVANAMWKAAVALAVFAVVAFQISNRAP
ncbi:hypothetical protein [Halobacterium wangiae]|uniref:hypothetical protein n=1 Tax=Halobacterium wangiae TaxID=2902623 RepID=UPI001E579D0F|nr:hypothetical protein [Halobacterium wangiae]